MPTVKVALPLTPRKLLGITERLVQRGAALWDHLTFTVEDGELIVSTEPLGDDPSINPQTEGVYAQ